MSTETEYEVINKETGETLPVISMSMGNQEVTVEVEGNSITFTNIEASGNLENEAYAIRQVGTNLTANNDGVISDTGEETAVTPSEASEIRSESEQV
tara:strand:+ start:9091 stop:9381 length:291 start_codon:yes stop_codon:yes gene_type:complete